MPHEKSLNRLRPFLGGVLILILAHFSVQAQRGVAFQDAILRRINLVRDSMHLAPVAHSKALMGAAQMQAEWSSRHDTLMHDQPHHPQKTALYNRVVLKGGNHNGLSENVMFLIPPPGRPMAEWAVRVVDHSMSSPTYARNIIAPGQRYCGIGIFFEKKTNRLCVCQVFAEANWQPPAKVHINKHAFGTRPTRDKACKKLDKHPGLEVDYCMRWDYEIPEKEHPRRAKISFFHNLYTQPREILRKPRGKVAPDFIFRDQFPCCAPNVLHGSPYHDGYLKRPRGWGFMAFWHNRPMKKDEKKLLVQTHRTPFLPEDSMQTNTLITKKHGFCRYGIEMGVMAAHLGPFDYQFAPDTIAYGKGQQWRRKQLTFKVPFMKGLAIPDSASLVPLMDSLLLPGAELMSIRIRGWASVEGTLEINQDLYKRRAQSILDRVQARQLQTVRMSSTSAENWPDFRRDLRGTAWAPLLRMSNERVRDTLTRDKALLAALEPLLARHRYATVEVDLRFAIRDSVTNEMLIDSLSHALATKQYRGAHAVQSEMWRRWQRNEFPADTFLKVYFPRVEACLPMIHNQRCMQDLLKRDSEPDTSDPPRSLSKTYPWFEARKVLALSIYANRPLACLGAPTFVLQLIQNLKKRQVPEDLIRRMELNYYTGLGWLQSINNGVDKKILKEVQKRYAHDTLDAERAYRLGLYFNETRSCDETIKLIRPFMKPGIETEDLVFLFAWTAMHTPELVSEDEWLGWMEKAASLNPERWHRKVDRDWQLLRWERLKRLYCNCDA